MIRFTKDRCPWCTNPEGCEGCSLSGEPAGNYRLISEADHRRQLHGLHHRWWLIAAALVGTILGLTVGLLIVLL